MTTYSNSKLSAFEQCKLGCQYTDVSSDWFRVVFLRKGVEKGVEKILSDKEKALIDVIVKNPNISKKDMGKMTGLSKKAVEYNIDKLKEKGLLKRIGPDKGGYWEVR